MIPKTKADVILRWPSGRESIVGTLCFEFTKDGIEGEPKWNVIRRFGWAMIKQGIAMMISGNEEESNNE